MRGRLLRVLLWSVGLLVVQAAVAVLRPVPRQEEFDATAVVGGTSPEWRWVVVGDSTTTGPGVSGPHEIWVRQLAERFCDTRCIDVSSFAMGGSRARDVVRLQLEAATAVPADIAFVSVGANDVLKGVSLADFSRNLEEIVAALTAVHGLVVVSGVGDLASIPRLQPPLRDMVRARGRRFDEAAAAIANRHGAVKVDQWALTAPLFATTPNVFSADLFHPTSVGHRIWADAVEATIRPHLSL
jgi:lysophospholipase L1-like esterase